MQRLIERRPPGPPSDTSEARDSRGSPHVNPGAGRGCLRAVCSCGWQSPVFGADKTTGTMDPLQQASDARDLHEWDASLLLARRLRHGQRRCFGPATLASSCDRVCASRPGTRFKSGAALRAWAPTRPVCCYALGRGGVQQSPASRRSTRRGDFWKRLLTDCVVGGLRIERRRSNGTGRIGMLGHGRIVPSVHQATLRVELGFEHQATASWGFPFRVPGDGLVQGIGVPRAVPLAGFETYDVAPEGDPAVVGKCWNRRFPLEQRLFRVGCLGCVWSFRTSCVPDVYR
jgi:hypothetical protein